MGCNKKVFVSGITSVGTPLASSYAPHNSSHAFTKAYSCKVNQSDGKEEIIAQRIEVAVDFLLCVGDELGEAVEGDGSEDGDGGGANIRIEEVEIPSLFLQILISSFDT
ncbi:hypothetical protein ACE6H2_002595 [Prunus campanulata]